MKVLAAKSPGLCGLHDVGATLSQLGVGEKGVHDLGHGSRNILILQLIQVLQCVQECKSVEIKGPELRDQEQEKV